MSYLAYIVVNDRCHAIDYYPKGPCVPTMWQSTIRSACLSVGWVRALVHCMPNQ